jgi:N-succinyldiaminopimelate aminotransferase
MADGDRVPYLTSRLQGFGTTIFAEMSALAVETGAVNLGQGFPDEDGPSEVLDAAVEAIRTGHNQYPPGRGVPELRAAIARHQQHWYGLTYDPATEVLVTAGATEAIAAACLALCEPGDEVVVLEPTYDSYQASIAMAGATPRFVRLEPPDYRLDPDALAAAITPRTRLLLINSPHNPTGTVLGADELDAIARLAVERDLLVVTDEVYEHLVFDGLVHVPLATLPGMRERTVCISSGGKTFNTTGWKVGWVTAPAPLVTAVTTAKQFLTYVNAGPLQPAIAAGLALPDEWFRVLGADLAAKRDVLCAGLEDAGFTVFRPQGTYFVTVDIRPLRPDGDGMAFCRELPHRCGVVAVPNQVFYGDPAAGRHLVRFAFPKRLAVLDEAAARLSKLATPGAGETNGGTL